MFLLQRGACAALLAGLTCWLWGFQAVAADSRVDDQSSLPRHPLEVAALTEPDRVLSVIPQALAEAAENGDGREVALLYLAQANACRMIADWPCQRSAGASAREHGDAAGEPILSIRGLIAEARADFALQDYSIGERLLGEAESRLRRNPSHELAADVALAYSSLSDYLGKHQLAVQYADRGLAELAPGTAQSMRVRLLRNRARGLAFLGQLEQARDALAEGLVIAERIIDPKLRAEIHLEAARVARTSGDRAQVESNIAAAQALAGQLQNSQLAGQAHEVLGLSAVDGSDQATALRELGAAIESFRTLGLARDELRVLRELVGAQIGFRSKPEEWSDSVQRMLELETGVLRSDRARASDDFDARLAYVEQALDMTRLESDAALAREREQAMDQKHKLTGFLVFLSIAMVVTMAIFFLAQRRLNRQLHAALDARLRALTQTSHELRNPISGILGLSELMLQSSLTPAQRSMVDAVHSAGSTIEKLAQDLLDRGRIESGQLSLLLKPTSLRTLAETVQQLYLPRAGEKGLQLRLDLSPELADGVMVDSERMQQVLSNLIGNSLKFTEQGEISLSVKQLARSSDGRVRVKFAVRDSGPGIEPDEIEGLFEPFAKGRAGKHHRAGAGLGLAISADLVRLMGGEIVVDSVPGKGACFQFELTLMLCAQNDIVREFDIGPQGVGLSVLLVDDDEDVTLALRSQLEVLGCEVTAVGSSQAARSMVAAQHFDLLMLDVELPDGKGPDLARALRVGEPNMLRSRVSIVSGHQAPKPLPAGIDEWLTKPVRLERLNMLLANARNAPKAERAA
jgi:signal transduction histidine kinase/ActR/RegA family two-component response regulator